MRVVSITATNAVVELSFDAVEFIGIETASDGFGRDWWKHVWEPMCRKREPEPEEEL